MARFYFGKPKASKEKLKKNMLQKVSAFDYAEKNDDGFYYMDVVNAPFKIGGIVHPKNNCGEYYRLDALKKDEYSDANKSLAECTAGGTVRFATDAEEISIRMNLRAACVGMHHFADRGVYGIDVYTGTGTQRSYAGDKMQFFTGEPNFHQDVLKLESGVKEIQINLPLYGGIEKMEIGFHKSDRVGEPTPRTVGAIAFYGSSVTQGGCVSRPANSYCNIICRALDADCCNYGFSGSAMGELAVAEHIASRDLACFVMDYDYNAPSHEHLAETHEKFFQLVREKNPELPIVIVTHPTFNPEPNDFDEKRFDIVKKTYKNAKANGDKNVYFVDSSDFFPKEMRDLYTVDNLHPNDLGQFLMAKSIFPMVVKALDL